MIDRDFDLDQTINRITSRRTIREFSDRKIGHGVIDQIISEGCEAPSSCNHQMWHYVVIEDLDKKEKLQKVSGSNKHFVTCSAMIIICFHKGWNHNKFAVVQSSAAAVYQMSISAHLRGIASTWNAGLGNTNKVAEICEIPSHFEIIGALCLGFPREVIEKQKPPRRPLASIRSYDTFQRPADEMYPLKPHRGGYPYHLMQNHDNKCSVFDPEKWTWDQIATFRGYAVYAKSPLPTTYISRRFGKEIQVEIGMFLKNKEVENVLEIMPYGGTYTGSLIRYFGEDVKVYLAALHQNNNNFILERLASENLTTENVFTDVIDNGNLPYGDNSFDRIFLPQILEAVPDKEHLLREIHRVLKPNGELVVSVRNSISWFGIYYHKVAKKAQVPNFGPYKPISWWSVISLLKEKFNIIEAKGVSSSPNKSGEISTGAMKRFSRLILIKASPACE